MEVKITNTLSKVLKTCYRMPGRPNDRANPVLSVIIQPRALLNSVTFPNESYFEEWKRQNQKLIDDDIIILGKATEKQAIAKNIENVKSINESKVNKINNVVTSLEKSADDLNAKVRIVTEELNKKR